MGANDTLFFSQIIEHDIIKSTLAKHDFLKPEIYDPSNGVRNPGLKFEKRDWFLPAFGDRVERVCVHFESVRPGHFCIHVEIDPYHKTKSIKPNDIRLVTLAREIQSKAILLDAIRDRIMTDAHLRNDVSASTSHLDPTDRPSTNAAVKFDRLRADCTPAECAAFFAHVLTTVTPIVDGIISEHLSQKR